MEMTQRFVALDVHKQYVMVAAIDATQQVTLSPRKISLEQFDAWVQTHLLPTDAVSDVNDFGSHSSHDMITKRIADPIILPYTKQCYLRHIRHGVSTHHYVYRRHPYLRQRRSP